jgi:hypothetical protein
MWVYRKSFPLSSPVVPHLAKNERDVGHPSFVIVTDDMIRDINQTLESAILELLTQRGEGKTICPSDAARHVDPENWRKLMEPTRAAGQRLASRGEIEVTQKGRVVDPSRAKGPIRFRRVC